MFGLCRVSGPTLSSFQSHKSSAHEQSNYLAFSSFLQLFLAFSGFI